MNHSRISPSHLHQTVACAASLQLQERIPTEPDTEEQQEGHAAHVVALHAATGELWPIGHTFQYGGREWRVDADMHDGAALYAENCGPWSLPGHQYEQAVHIRRIHAECWGTPDHWRVTLDGTKPILLELDDYKFGHRYVDAFENHQLAAYAIGVLDQLGISPGDDSLTVVLRIIQPRAYHKDGPVQEWRTTPFKLGKMLTVLRNAVAGALVTDPLASTGPHCLDCRARAACRTLQAAATGIVDYSMTADLQPLDVTAAAVELRILDEAAKRLAARRTGLAAQVESAARGGQRVPWWHMEPNKSNLAWLPNVSVDEAAGMAQLFGVNIRNPPELMTPTQAKAALKRKGVDEAVIDQYATRPPTGMKLVADDGRARKVFAHNQQETK